MQIWKTKNEIWINMKNERNEEWSYEEWKIWRMKENKNELELVLCKIKKSRNFSREME